MKSSFGLQVTAVVLVLLVGALCFPMPDGGLLINRLTGTVQVRDIAPAPRGTDTVIATVPVVAVTVPVTDALVTSTRFAQAVDVPAKSDEYWTAAMVEGQHVWLDAHSGMVWGPKLATTVAGFSNTDLATAKEACAQQAPVGAWALPTAAEFDMAKVNGIFQSDSDAKHSWITWQQVPPTLIVPSVRGYVRAGMETGYAIRCIARTEKAPADGYLSTDNETTLKAFAE